jgi:hypothetical protein
MTLDNNATRDIRLSLGRKNPMKKTYRISNKTIIVIDETLVNLPSIDENKTWFEEQATKEGILLKIHQCDTETGDFSLDR